MKSERSENIFLFVPNLIGYARIVLAVVSFYYMPFSYPIAVFCYVLSALLDAIDGYAARYLNQSTKFGAVLDQLTDRCATMCLLVVLSNFYPKYMFAFQLSMTIDIACHWIYVQTSVMEGRTSHKYVNLSENAVMRLYYTSRPVLFAMCATNEAFYAALYLLHFTSGPLIPVLNIHLIPAVAYVCGPFAVVKTLISLLQGFTACVNLGTIDRNERNQIEDKTN